MYNDSKRNERRTKRRFPIHWELRYKLLEDDTIIASGSGQTVDVSSGGVAIQADTRLIIGAFVEISISWPVLLNETCPMRLIVFGRVVRTDGTLAVCTIDKYEFRTQARKLQIATPVRTDSKLQRWADGIRKEGEKLRAAMG